MHVRANSLNTLPPQAERKREQLTGTRNPGEVCLEAQSTWQISSVCSTQAWLPTRTCESVQGQEVSCVNAPCTHVVIATKQFKQITTSKQASRQASKQANQFKQNTT
jgi:hypothetical protein